MVSTLLHLLVLLLYSGIEVIPTVTISTPDGGESTLEGIQLIEVVIEEDEEDEEEEEALAEALPAPETPPAEAGEPAAQAGEFDEPVAETDAEVEPVPEGTPAADRLRAQAPDPKLYPVNLDIQRLTAEQIMELDLMVSMEAIRDSIAAAQARAEAYTDWTFTDAEGKRWGVTPGKLHLGGITLPLPFGFGSTPWNLTAERERATRDAEIERQAITGLILETWEERFRAMRARADRARRERNEAQADTTRFH
ncbi:MAG: hypothetical protein RQ745_08720 [Longimicrobiales bacterium]|nr:hypothetical protein [Longimicrobiales bacterium]